ncbi:helix-hairpin-helix domain-containing protein [Arthrobacter sp. Bi83]|uniref:ComEA family DNA-binding protein n=1 Tax=Arthrobacter sp. Bi83 TaxID=2822353 RepID=UPI001E4DE735|nr:helix-hairpin-helix domain-containing protein [Arthrobacter sp. Bi83]
MSRRTAGPAASDPSRSPAGLRPPEGAEPAAPASSRQPASRLAARLGAPQVGDPFTERAGLLEMGDGRGFSYRSGDRAARDFRDSPASHPSGTAEARVRWRLGVRAAVLLGIMSLLVGGWFWWRVAATEPEVVPLGAVTTGVAATPDAGAGGAEEDVSDDAGGPAESGGPGSGPASDAPSGSVVVHVAGAVKRTGVVKVPRGGRVHEAIAAAGGGTADADLNRLNLAAELEDGEKIYVPRRGEAAPPEAVPQGAQPGGSGSGSSGTGSGASAAGGRSGSTAAKTNLNSASAEELGSLPRVGPVLAQRIVDWRAEHGPFKTVEELDAVDGVGPKMLETLLPLVTV